MGYTIQYYDLVLLAIIAPILIGFGIGSLTSVPMPLAIVGLGAVSIGVMVYALFVNGPVDELADLSEAVEELV